MGYWQTVGDLVDARADELVLAPRAVPEPDAPRGGLVHAGDQVEDRRLAGAVRTDERGDRPVAYLEVHVLDRADATELLAESVGCQNDALVQDCVS